MTKYHISTSNKTVICKAEKQTCPRQHYTTKIEAQTVINNKTTPETTPYRTELVKIAAEYGLNPNEITDHTGQTLTQAWNKNLNDNTYDPNIPTLNQFITNILEPINMDGVRTRGTYIVFAEDDYPYVDPSSVEDEEEIIATPANVEENLTKINPAYIALYTRNGGGNRECHCYNHNEPHEPGCTGAAVDRLEDHPLFTSSNDNEYDRTYATFYFKIPAEQRQHIKAVLENDEAFERTKNRTQLLKTLETKKTPIYQILHPNPVHEQKIQKLNETNTTLRQKKDTLLKTKITPAFKNVGLNPTAWPYRITDAHIQAIQHIAEAYRNNTPYMQTRNPFTAFSPTVAAHYKEALKAKQIIAKTNEITNQYNEAFAKLEKTDPQLAEALKQTTSPKYSTTTTAYQQAQQTVRKYETQLAVVVNATQALDTLTTKINNNQREIDHLRTILCWPGTEKTVPHFEETP